jgi:tetratricopeptide (TPR) repeat protein
MYEALPGPGRDPGRFLPLLALALTALLLGGGLCGNKAQTNPQMLIQQVACVENIQKGDFERAESRCEICLEFDGRNAECLNGMGLIWYSRGVDEKAEKFFRTAIRENNDFAQARNNLGVLKFENGDFPAAAEMFASAIEVDPRYIDSRYNLGLTHLRLGYLEKTRAEEHLIHRLNLTAPKDPKTGVVQMTTLESRIWRQADDSDSKKANEHFENAESEFRKLFELAPTHINGYRDMGLIMTYRAAMQKIENKKLELLADSERYFVRCLDLDPENEPCHESMGHTLKSIGRYDEALFHFVQCLAANLKNPVCNLGMKDAYAGSQLKSESLRQYMTQLADNPGYAMGHYGFCMALFEKKMVEMAVTECENALKLDETLCLAHYQLGKHYQQSLDRDLALEHCRALITCSAETRYPAEVADCKEIVQALEVQ